MSDKYTYRCILTPNLEDKEIKRIYNKRRKILKTNHCPHCGNDLVRIVFNHRWFPKRKGEVLTEGGMTKEKKCPICETDLVEFCFQDMLDEVNAKVKKIMDIAKGKQNTPIKKHKGVNNKSSATKCSKTAIKKKCANKNGEEQRSLW